MSEINNINESWNNQHNGNEVERFIKGQIQAINDAEQGVNANEQARQTAEQAREEAESHRASAEEGRVSVWTVLRQTIENWYNGASSAWTEWFGGTKQSWTEWFNAVVAAWNNSVGNYYTKAENNELLSSKANIVDVYDKDTVDELLSSKANSNAVYDKGAIDSKEQTITQLLQQKQMEVGAVPSDLVPTPSSSNWVTSGGVFDQLYADRTHGMSLKRIAMAQKSGLTISSGTIATTSSNPERYIMNYYPCKKDEPFEFACAVTSTGVSGSATLNILYCTEIPKVGATYSVIHTMRSAEMVVGDTYRIKFFAPADGYILLRYYYSNSSSNYWSVAQLFKWFDMKATDNYLNKGQLTTTWETNRYVNADEESPTFGNVITSLGSSNYGTSKFIDIEGCGWLSFGNLISLSAVFNNITAGSVFYDANKQPISAFSFVQREYTTTYGIILVKVPDGARYIRVTALLTESETAIASQTINAWSSENIADNFNTRITSLENITDTDDVPVEGSEKLVKSGGVKEINGAILNGLGSAIASINGSKTTSMAGLTATTVCASFGRDGIIMAQTNEKYVVSYYTPALKKGMLIHFTATTTLAGRAQAFGFTRENPAELGSVIGLQLDHVEYSTGTTERDMWFVVPYDNAYLFGYHYDQDWASRSLLFYSIEDNFKQKIESDIYNDTLYDVEQALLTGSRYYSITVGSTTAGTNNNYRHNILWVADADYVEITANENSSAIVAWLTNANAFPSGGTLPLVDGIDETLPFIAAVAGNSVVLKVPEGAKTLAYYCGSYSSDLPNKPASIRIFRKRKCEWDGNKREEIEIITQNGYNPGTSSGSAVSTNAGCNVKTVKVRNGETYHFAWVNPKNYIYYALYNSLLNQGKSLPDDFTRVTANELDCSLKYKATSDGYLTFWQYPNDEFTLEAYRVMATDEVSIKAAELEQLSFGNKVFTEIDIDALAKKNYSMDVYGWFGSSTAYKHVRIGVSPGQLVKITANENYGVFYAWLTADSGASESKAQLVEGTARITIIKGTTTIVKVPDGATHMYVYLGSSDSGYQYRPSYIGLNEGESGAVVEPLPQVIALNDPVKLNNVIRQLHRPKGDDKIDQLLLLHFSDIHGNGTALKHVKQFRDYYRSFIDDVIHTGDSVLSAYNTHTMDFWNAAGVEDFLNVIGNHDGAHVENDAYTGYVHPADECYSKYIAPYADRWGAVTGENVCYYYKDYISQNVRLIVVDEEHYDSVQNSWLAATLADALAGDKHVIMATHSVNGPLIPAGSTFHNPTATLSGNGLHPTIGSRQRVQDFMDNGGQLICWLCGHGHYDFIGFSQDFPQQLRVLVTTQAPERAANYNVDRTVGFRQEDAFNLVAVDTKYKMLRIARIGADYDRFMQHLDMFAYNYGTRRVLVNKDYYTRKEIDNIVGNIEQLLQTL